MMFLAKDNSLLAHIIQGDRLSLDDVEHELFNYQDDVETMDGGGIHAELSPSFSL